MITILSALKSMFLKIFYIGTDDDPSVTSRRITIFTNSTAILATIMGLSVYSQLDKFGVPMKFAKMFYILALLAITGLSFNYMKKLMLGRIFFLLLIAGSGINAVMIFGKSFNGDFVFFLGIFFSVLAFSRYNTYIRVIAALFSLIWLPLTDILSHQGTFPLTDLHSKNFPVTVLVSDSIILPVIILVMLWIEKTMADRHEEGLELALKQVEYEKQKIKLILDNIELGIFMTDAQLKFADEHSRHLTKIVEKDELSGEDIFDIIFAHSDLSSEEISTLKDTLFLSIGEDSLNWDLNSGHLISEIKLQVHGHTKYLSLTWSPILDGDLIHQVIVTLKDTTAEREVLARLQEGEALVNYGRKVFAAVIEHGSQPVKDFLQQLILVFNEQASFLEDKPKENKVLLRNLHTLKGEARLLGFADISNQIHLLEGQITDPSYQGDWWDCGSEDIRKLVTQLDSVGSRIFSGVSGEKKKWSILSHLAKVKEGLNTYLKSTESFHLESFRIDDRVQDWPPDYVKVVQVVTLHGVQNAVDHGYVLPKLDRDVIVQVSTLAENGFSIIIEDEGNGIDIAVIQKKLTESGDQNKNICIEDALFSDSFTTAQEVSLTSGRGVGLAEIKGLVEGFGGTVSLSNKETGPGAQLKVWLPTVS